jgi:hypothetical protein
MATDKNRINFLSGFRTSPQGAYEDPTYLGFKIFFVFDDKTIDQATGLPESPFFVDRAYNDDIDRFGISGINTGNPIAFHSAQSYLSQREDAFDNGIFGSITSNKRADLISQFKSLLRQINDQTPWFFQSISGLDKLASVSRPGYNSSPASADGGFNPHRTGGKSLTISCLESLNIRITALAELYRQATFDYDNMRELLPRNLRKFKMYIYVSEVRNFNKTNRLSAVSAAARTLEGTSNLLTNGMNPGNSINQDPTSQLFGTGLNSTVSGILNKSGLGSDLQAAQDLVNQGQQSGITPYIIFECSQCEFDFDSSYPIGESINNGGDAIAATQSFKIYVDRVKTKIQMPNIRDDGNFLILKDGWDQNGSSFKKYFSRSLSQSNNFLSSLLTGGENLLTNFVGNSINNVVNTQISRLSRALSGVDQTLLGNVYSFNPGAIINQPSFDNASQLADQFRNGLDLRSVFNGGSAVENPQTNGLGGPPQRVYPSPEGDVYSGVPGQDLGVPDRIYPQPNGDVYPTSPGSDLGLPDRSYLQPSGDVYPSVPGPDLGPVERIYTQPTGDVYENVPGRDLGVPDRAYIQPSGDFYPDSPGRDLGVPDRIYSSPEGDVYPTSPGRDLGVPDRSYRADLNDVYPTSPGRDLGVPDRQYGLDRTTVYPDSSQQSSSQNLGSLYEFQPSVQENLNSRVYAPQDSGNSFESRPANQYGQSPASQTPRELGSLYPPTSGDFSPETTSLGNLKPADRYNFSLDDVNGIDED